MNTETQTNEGQHMQDIIQSGNQGVVDRVVSRSRAKYAAAGAAAGVALMTFTGTASAADLTGAEATEADLVTQAKKAMADIGNDGKSLILYAALVGFVLIGLGVLWARSKKAAKSLAS